ncbi:MAG TPA: S8 family serine peptidase, partial [Candidatus Thermoplasmatota archaeon]|nr:S8 family serine peptidase [Candidatus Thermoplasmatota archaeon]
ILWCADHAPRNTVINLSLGTSQYSRVVAAAAGYAYREKGQLLVAAAGNSGCHGCIGLPAALPEAIAVTCTAQDQSVCAFSSTGPEADLSAPGHSVLSTLPPCNGPMLCSDTGYGTLSGTSMSAPHAAGVAALVWSQEPGLSNGGLRERLQRTAADLGAPGRDDRYGHGRVDAACALLAQTDCPTAGGPTGEGPFDPHCLTAAGFGYTCATAPMELEELGDAAVLLPLGDDDEETVPLGFRFPFFESAATQVGVSSNGWLSWLPCCAVGTVGPRHGGGYFPAGILGYASDLDPRAGGDVSYATIGEGSEQRFVAQWRDVPHYGGSQPVTFQVVLFPDGRIEVRSGGMAPDGHWHATGLSGPGGQLVLYQEGAYAVPEGMGVRFTAAHVDLSLRLHAEAAGARVRLTNAGPHEEPAAWLRLHLSKAAFGELPSGCEADAGSVTCHVGALAPGAEASLLLPVTGTRAWTLTASGGGEGLDPDGVRPRSMTVNARRPGADLAVAVQAEATTSSRAGGPAPLMVGDTLSLPLTVENAGPLTATSVTVSTTLPRGASLVAPSAAGCRQSGAILTCTLGTLAAGDGATVTPTIQFSRSASTTLAVAATLAQRDPNGADNTATLPLEVLRRQADLQLARTTGTAVAGHAFWVTASVTNRGPLAAAAPELRERLPAGLTVAAAGGGCSEQAGTLLCILDDLAAGATRDIHYYVVAERAGSYTLMGSVASATVDLMMNDNTATSNVAVRPPLPDPAILWLDTWWPYADVGDWTSAWGGYTNRGELPTTDLAVTVQVPAGLRLLALSADHGECVV